MKDAAVLLLGGSSGVGKTQLAGQLARQLGIGWLSADDIRLALQRATRGSALPRLHAFFDDLPTLAAEVMAARYVVVAEIVSHALEIVVAHHVATGLPILIEGDTILPALAAQQSFAGIAVSSQVRAVFLVEPDPQYLQQNTLARGRGAEELSAAELATHVTFSWRYVQWLADQASAYQLPVLAPRPYATLIAKSGTVELVLC
jgi:2-phosphoglycerate kinase